MRSRKYASILAKIKIPALLRQKKCRETWRVQACFLPEDVQYAQEKLCA